jgi:hypothetical protein
MAVMACSLQSLEPRHIMPVEVGVLDLAHHPAVVKAVAVLVLIPVNVTEIPAQQILAAVVVVCEVALERLAALAALVLLFLGHLLKHLQQLDHPQQLQIAVITFINSLALGA